MRMYAVGGFVRDRILGQRSKDLDFSVEAESYDHMIEELERRGVEFYLETPEYYTARGMDPKWGPVDYVWARKDGPYTDNRHPDFVEPGTINDDLARRDFTMNAMAVSEVYLEPFLEGNFDLVHDPFNGRVHLDSGLIFAVGEPYERFREDALRVIRAMRFSVTKEMSIGTTVRAAMNHGDIFGRFASISSDRVREELDKMFRYDNIRSMNMLVKEYPEYLQIIGDVHGVWFKPTSEAR